MEMGISDRLVAEFSLLEPVYVDGLADVVNLGTNIAMWFFRWGLGVNGWEKIPAVNLVRPRSSVLDPASFMQIVKSRVPAPSEAAIIIDLH